MNSNLVSKEGILRCIESSSLVHSHLHDGYADALEPIVEVLKEGLDGTCEQAARILFNFSTSPDRRPVIGNSTWVVRVLVTMSGRGTLQFQQIVNDTLNNLFLDALEPIVQILKEGLSGAREQAARILFNFSISPNRRRVIGNSGAVHTLLTLFSRGTTQFQQIASDTFNNLFPDALEPIAKVLKEDSSAVRIEAARILFNFCKKPNWRSVIGKSEAMLALVTLLGEESQQLQKIVTDTLNNLFPDVLEPIVKVLKVGSTKARDQAAKILFNFSTSLDRRSVIGTSGAMHALVTMLDDKSLQFQQIAINTLNNLFPDALESIAEVLKEGSIEARKQAARILFNFSTSPDKRSIIGNFGAMRPLVTLLGNGTLKIQQIVASTLNNLYHEILNEVQVIEVGLVSILMRLITEQPTIVLEEALPLVDKLLNFWNRSVACRAIRIEAPATTWLEFMASESPLNQERAASILYTLYYGDEQYSQQAKECQALERITQFTVFVRTRHNLLELLNSNVSNKNYPTLPVIPFPKKDWWSPSRKMGKEQQGRH